MPLLEMPMHSTASHPSKTRAAAGGCLVLALSLLAMAGSQPLHKGGPPRTVSLFSGARSPPNLLSAPHVITTNTGMLVRPKALGHNVLNANLGAEVASPAPSAMT